MHLSLSITNVFKSWLYCCKFGANTEILVLRLV